MGWAITTLGLQVGSPIRLDSLGTIRPPAPPNKDQRRLNPELVGALFGVGSVDLVCSP